MRDFDGPAEFLQSLRSAEIVTRPTSLLYVQALKFLQTRATPAVRAPGKPRAARAPRHRRGAPVTAGAGRERRGERGDPRGAPAAQAQVQQEGQLGASSKPSESMPVTDDEIREKYLERAIRELNLLTRELQACPHCPRGNLMPVLGSGHPQADIMLLKHSPLPSEIEEGVAFYGRAGGALMKSLKRL